MPTKKQEMEKNISNQRKHLRRIAIIVVIFLAGAITAFHLVNSANIKSNKEGLKESDARAKGFKTMGTLNYRNAVILYNNRHGINNNSLKEIDAISDSIGKSESKLNGF